MMKIAVRQIGKALHPSEVVVAVQTIEGPQNLVINKRAIENDSLDIGYPISSSADEYLIELPRETQGGSWRVWVRKDYVK
jgi:hypothetical protein